MLFRDVHELFRPGALAEMQKGVVNGTQITEELLLLGGILVEIPILMVLLSRILGYNGSRWANFILAPITIMILLLNGFRDADDIFFIVVEVIALLAIFYTASKWKNPKMVQANSVGHDPHIKAR